MQKFAPTLISFQRSPTTPGHLILQVLAVPLDADGTPGEPLRFEFPVGVGRAATARFELLDLLADQHPSAPSRPLW